ncbi:MAG: RING finger protein [Oscillospiraceae bacterium]
MNFIGEECIVCHEKFTDDDDIVVCEVCGTPYHRKCYKVFNRCINQDLHEKGLSFKPTQITSKEIKSSDVDLKSSSHEKSQPNEDLEDNSYNRFIEMSKDILNQVNLNPDENIHGVSTLEFYLYTKSLGSTRKFYKLKDTNKKRAFNIFALLIPEYYLASKKMYVETVFTFLVNFFLEIPMLIQYYNQIYENSFELLVNNTIFKMVGNVFMALFILFRVFLSFSILPRYFDNCVKNIKTIKGRSNKNVYLKKLLEVREGFNFFAILIVMLSSEILKFSLYFLTCLLYNQYI